MKPGKGLILATVTVVGIVACGAASALTVRVMSGSAAGLPSTFTTDGDAPQSTFQKAGIDGSLQSVFVASEVSPARLETTQALLSELGARRSDGTIIIDLPADVLFDFDKATIRRDAEVALTKARDLLTSYPTAQVTIGGHTDSKGDDAYNAALSLRRAQAVASRLQDSAGRTLTSEGFGENRPVAANSRPDGSDDPDGRQKNRRVEIRITPTPDSGKRP